MAQAHASEVPADADILRQVPVPPSPSTSDMDSPLAYYHLEAYLFDTVRPRFFRDHGLKAFDLFSIIIWKANRAKTRIARRLLKCSSGNCLDEAALQLTRALFAAADARSRLKILIDSGFHLPMASAILTVLWPEDFTVYDVRACEQLHQSGLGPQFSRLGDAAHFEVIWAGYRDYVEAVRRAVPGPLSLRDKDRILWAQSAMAQLRRDIANNFWNERP